MIEQAEQFLTSTMPASVTDIAARFRASGRSLFLVGGSVRDAIMGMPPKDFDLATDALPEETISILAGFRTKLHGEAFAVVVVYTDDNQEGFEIASFREDSHRNYNIESFIEYIQEKKPVNYEERINILLNNVQLVKSIDMLDKEIHWTQNAELIFPEEFRDFSKISGRHPEVRTGVTIEQDVQRRDFTCNALFFDISSKKIIDLVGGVEDIEHKLIRCVGNPMDRFREDQLRTLRAVRFAVRMGFEIEQGTMDAIVSGADLSDISRERVVMELTKTLDSGDSEKLFSMLVKTGMLHKCLLTRSWKGTSEVSATFCEEFRIDGHVNPSLFLAQVFADTADLTHLEELLHQSKWSTDDIRGCITLLRWERSLSFDTAFGMFRDLQKIRWGTSDSILDVTDFKRHFASRGRSSSLMLALLTEFKVTVKAEELMVQGFKGRELGEKIAELETQNIKLLWCSRGGSASHKLK